MLVGASAADSTRASSSPIIRSRSPASCFPTAAFRSGTRYAERSVDLDNAQKDPSREHVGPDQAVHRMGRLRGECAGEVEKGLDAWRDLARAEACVRRTRAPDSASGMILAFRTQAAEARCCGDIPLVIVSRDPDRLKQAGAGIDPVDRSGTAAGKPEAPVSAEPSHHRQDSGICNDLTVWTSRSPRCGRLSRGSRASQGRSAGDDGGRVRFNRTKKNSILHQRSEFAESHFQVYRWVRQTFDNQLTSVGQSTARLNSRRQ